MSGETKEISKKKDKRDLSNFDLSSLIPVSNPLTYNLQTWSSKNPAYEWDQGITPEFSISKVQSQGTQTFQVRSKLLICKV